MNSCQTISYNSNHSAVLAAMAHREADGISMSLDFFVSFLVKQKRKEANNMNGYI
jgi:hypothetical protein